MSFPFARRLSNLYFDIKMAIRHPGQVREVDMMRELKLLRIITPDENGVWPSLTPAELRLK